MVVDAGPGPAVSSCLGKYMPFYDRTIEFALLSHPQKDHYGGYLSLLGHYKIKQFITVPIKSKFPSFIDLENELKKKSVPISYLYAGDRVVIDKTSSIHFLWPDKDYVAERSSYAMALDPNNFSQVFVFRQGLIDVLFTGDIPSTILSNLEKSTLYFPDNLEVLKVPHHGSKTGLSEQILELADPLVSVIMVGKHNRYGHPSKQVLDMFRALKKIYLTTATNGDVVVETDGISFSVKADNFYQRFRIMKK